VPHVQQTTRQGLVADIRAGVAQLRSADGDRSVRTLFTVGFCFGGRLAFMTPAMALDLAGTIGFYGRPTARSADDAPVPIDIVGAMHGSVLGLFGGADPGIPADSIDAFDAALTAAGVDHRLVTYPSAPHSFFDRKAEEYAEASADAWSQTLAFIRERTVPPA
jgi:carboxymethylenebutenolidase